MAVDVCCSEIPCSGFSPRISFSYDLNQTDGGGGGGGRGDVRLDSNLLDSASEFDFCVGSANSVQELSPADELFSNGKILPIQIKKDEPFSQKPVRVQRSASLSSSSSSSSCSSCHNQKAPEKKRLKELLLMSPDSDLDERPSSSSSSSRSFWQFKRSVSLNYDRNPRKGLIRSLHFLSRSNSTGSAPNPKRNLQPKETQHSQRQQNHPKQPSPLRRSSTVSTTGAHSSNSLPRKSFGVRVNPVLNFPPPSFMSNAIGFGSFLCSGKMKRKK